MKIIIAGGRDFKDYELMKRECDSSLSIHENVEVVSGRQVTIDKETGDMYGADYLGEQYAKERGYPVKPFPADWKKYGLSAGPRRNAQMAEYAEGLIAFWDGKSKGTKDMIDKARTKGLPVRIINYT